MRGRVAGVVLLSIASAAASLAACGHDDYTLDIPDAEVDATSPTADSSEAADSNVASIVDASDAANETDASNAADASDAADANDPMHLCDDYCLKFKSQCGYTTSSKDSYPSGDVCLAICALMPKTDVAADSLACRETHLTSAASPAPDCPAAGPWGYDANTRTVCAAATAQAQPCFAVCRAITSICAAAGVALTDCTTTCNALEAKDGTADDACLEESTLNAYAAASVSDVTASCNAFKACGR